MVVDFDIDKLFPLKMLFLPCLLSLCGSIEKSIPVDTCIWDTSTILTQRR